MRGKGLVDELVDGVVVLAQDLGVVRVGGDALYAERRYAERPDIGSMEGPDISPTSSPCPTISASMVVRA